MVPATDGQVIRHGVERKFTDRVVRSRLDEHVWWFRCVEDVHRSREMEGKSRANGKTGNNCQVRGSTCMMNLSVWP